MLILTVSRFLWFINNSFWLGGHNFFAIVRAFFTGAYFDLPVVAYFFLPVWLLHMFYPPGVHRFPKFSKLLFTISAGICILLNGIDTAYSQITTKRSGFELFHSLSDEGNKLMPYFRDYWYLVLIVISAVVIIYRFMPAKGNSLYLYKASDFLKSLLIIPCTAAIWLLFARGGLQLKPLRSLDAGKYVSNGLSALATSTPLQIMSTMGQNEIPEFVFMDENLAESLVLAEFKNSTKSEKKNVVLIIVESLGRDYTGFLNNQPFTPFLDSLSRHSTNFRYCYSTGNKSIDMVPSIFCGIAGLGNEHYINSLYASNTVKNAFAAFSDQGYSTAFFHGAANGTMGFQSFLGSTGLINYYGLNEYPDREKDHDGNWGIYDEPYLQYFLKYLDTVRKPTFSAVFTLSSHHPYAIPSQYRNQLPKGPLPIHQSIAYADLALRKFFESAKSRDWFKNTLFVITGDHTSYGTKDYFYSQTGHYEIPLLFYMEGKMPAVIDKSLSQCDILPTAIDYLKLPVKYFGLGRSAVDDHYKGYALHIDNGLYYMISYPYAIGIDESGKVRDQHKRFRNDSLSSKLEPADYQLSSWMLPQLKAYLQVYSSRMRNNNWKIHELKKETHGQPMK